MSRNPVGPWLAPRLDTLDAPLSGVMKTAPFSGGRRIGADGTLGAKFVPEMTPTGAAIPAPSAHPLTADARVTATTLQLANRHGLAAAAYHPLPYNFRLCATIAPQVGAAEFGLCLRATDSIESGYDLSFAPHAALVRLGNQMLTAVAGLAQPFTVEIVASGNITDGRRTLINRCPEKQGERLLFYARNGDVTFTNLALFAL